MKSYALRRHWFAVHASNRKLSLAVQTFLAFICDEGSLILHE